MLVCTTKRKNCRSVLLVSGETMATCNDSNEENKVETSNPSTTNLKDLNEQHSNETADKKDNRQQEDNKHDDDFKISADTTNATALKMEPYC